jgi:hypothetical protein
MEVQKRCGWLGEGKEIPDLVGAFGKAWTLLLESAVVAGHIHGPQVHALPTPK